MDVIIGNSVSIPKFRFIYHFYGENGKSLALELASSEDTDIAVVDDFFLLLVS